jgi:AraC family transcriptional regulator
MSAIIDNMGHVWNRDPRGIALGSNRTGICAALWNSETSEIIEVTGDSYPDYHIACLQMTKADAEFLVDEKPRYDGSYVPGNVSFVHAGAQPRAIMRGRFSCMHLYIPPSLIEDITDNEIGGAAARNIALRDTVGTSSPGLLRIGQELLMEMHNGDALARLRTDALGLEAAIQILRHHSTFAPNALIAKTNARGGLAPWQIRRVVELLSADPAVEHPLASLAELVRLSPFHFSRAFKKSLGVPPHAYQMKLRVERAKLLLTSTSQSVTQIAHEVGYESSQALARAFLRQVGATPSQFRRDRL